MPNLTEQEFSKHIGSEFQAYVNQNEVALKLADVKGYLSKPNEQSGMERFSAFFDGPGEMKLPQAIYHLRHEKMGEFDLFLVPVSGDANGFRYEAVFNYYKE